MTIGNDEGDDGVDTKEAARTLRSLLELKQNQGYAVRVGTPDYRSLVLGELNRLEHFSSEYSIELQCLSTGIRNYLWNEHNTSVLYQILYVLNEVYEALSDIISPDVFWNIDIIFEYIEHLSVHARELRVKDQAAFDRIIDKVIVSRNKPIIEKQWEDILAHEDGNKAFLEVFDDVFRNAIEKYETDFIHALEPTDVLCRMAKVKECNEDRFIPWTNKAQNRWNPPGKTFLYLSYGKQEQEYNMDLSLAEYICLLECKLDEECDTCFCRFKSTKPGRILDLSYNDITLTEMRHQLDGQVDSHAQSLIDRLINDKNVMDHAMDEEYVKEYIAKLLEGDPLDVSLIEKNTAKQVLKLICSCIYKRVNEKDALAVEKAYKSFQLLAAYLETHGITGIIYPCTRTNKIKGKNVVLFDIRDAEPIKGTIKQYHFCGDYMKV